MSDDEKLKILKQEKQVQELLESGTKAWTVVYDNWYEPDIRNGGHFAVFTQPKNRKEVLSSESWDASKGDGLPGFTQYYSKSGIRTKYLRYGNVDGVEPLIITQNHHGVRPRMLPQISEEFRLYHNLWADPSGKKLYKIGDDGNDEVAVEISHDLVRVRTTLLRQFQAGRQLDLVLSVDSVVIVDDKDESIDLTAAKQKLKQENTKAFVEANGYAYGWKRPMSRFLGKKVLPPPPQSKAGIWPFDKREEDFPEFIIGETPDGDQITSTCDPELLANNFGKNPDASHYLTPVFFRRQVLQKYFEQPEKYEVRDGYLSCGGLWGLRLDNDHPEHVMVFLGDLGRDLPSSERPYWRSFNIVPSGGISETVWKRSFMGEFAGPEAPDLRFKSQYPRFNKAWDKNQGWTLFKPMHEADAHVLKQLRIPLADSQPEFEDQVRCLVKLLIDALNESAIQSKLPNRVDGEKGLGKLKRWLEQEKYPYIDRDIVYLQRLQRLRSKMAAHRKGTDYDKVLKEESVDDDKIAEVVHLLWGASKFLEGLSTFFNIPDGF